jgi:hypothetical protein
MSGSAQHGVATFDEVTPHTGPFPATITAVIADITNNAAQPPVAEQIRRGKWRLTITCGRVHAAVRFKTYFHGGRTRITQSAIEVDGKHTSSYCCGQCLADLICRTSPDAAPAIPDPMPEPAAVENAPPIVRIVYQGMNKGTAKNDEVTVQLGNPSPERWVIGIDFPTGSLRLYFRHFSRSRGATGTSRWSTDRNPIQLIINGLDRTRDVDGNMAKALELLLGSAPSSKPEAPHTIGRPADAKRTNSVLVRRSTVIRV